MSVAVNRNIEQHTLPKLTISDKGQLIFEGNRFHYQPWSSDSLTGKVFVIQAMAGRTSSQQMNAPLIEAIKQAELPPDAFQVVTIINTNDALIGTAGFVRSSIESNKRQHPEASFVVDRCGNMLTAWGLSKRSSAIILLDNAGMIRFAKDGALTPEEVQHTMQMIEEQL